VRTPLQELSSLQLTGEPVIVQRRNTQVPDGSARGNKKKRMLPHRPTQDQELEVPSGESCTGTDVNTGGSSRTKRKLSPGGTPQDAQNQVKRTKQKQKEAPHNS